MHEMIAGKSLQYCSRPISPFSAVQYLNLLTLHLHSKMGIILRELF